MLGINVHTKRLHQVFWGEYRLWGAVHEHSFTQQHRLISEGVKLRKVVG